MKTIESSKSTLFWKLVATVAIVTSTTLTLWTTVENRSSRHFFPILNFFVLICIVLPLTKKVNRKL